MKNKTQALGIGAVVIIVIGAVVYFMLPKNLSLLGDDITLTAYAANGTMNGEGAVTVPFIARDPGVFFVNVAIDANNDGTFSSDEWVVKNLPTGAYPSEPNRFTFNEKDTSIFSKTDVPVRTILSAEKLTSFDQPAGKSETKDKKLNFKTYDFGKFISLAKVTKPKEANLGIPFIPTAFAQKTTERPGTGTNPPATPPPSGENPGATPPAPDQQPAQPNQPAPPTDVHTEDVPDFKQQPQECVPTSVANNLTSLVNKNGNGTNPQDSKAMIEELKTDMSWTFENGVLNGDVIAGKAKYAMDHNLPINTESMSSANGNASVEEIANALNNKKAVELKINFAELDAEGNATIVGAHVVTVIGVHMDPNSYTLTLHDPLSQKGSDTYEIAQNGQVINYPYQPGDNLVTYMGTGWSQAWTNPPLTGNAGTMEQPEMQGLINEFGKSGSVPRIQVLTSGDHQIPIAQVYLSDPGQCHEKHWHSVSGVSVTDLKGSAIPDHEPCGYGTQSQDPVEWIPDPNFKPKP